MVDRKYLGIQKVTVNGVDETNVLDIDIWLVDEQLKEDLVEVQFTPNTIEGVGFKCWAKCWLIKVVHDGVSDVWDDYIDDDLAGAVIPSFSVTFDIVEILTHTTQIWTFAPNKCYIANRDDVEIEMEAEVRPGTIYVLCIGDVEITHV